MRCYTFRQRLCMTRLLSHLLAYTVTMDIRALAREEMPSELLEIPQPPERLWARGAFPAPGTKRLAVVGSRALSSYGKSAIDTLVGGLAGYPVSIVSGLALGADAAAHRAALAAGLHTIAIPGSGLDDSVIGPRTNLPLARDILKAGGLLLSEHEPRYVAHPYDFPSRNRIMVGLSDAVLMIEAGEKSGTLITARLAADYSRELLCIPHRLHDPHGFGPHLFLRLGAGLVTEPLHILEALGIPPREESPTSAVPADLSDAEEALYGTLAEPLSRDDAIRSSGIAPGEALTALISLELRGLVKEELGLWRRH